MLDAALDLIEAKMERLPTDINDPNHPWNVMFREIHQTFSEETKPTAKDVKDDLWDAVHRADLQTIEVLKADNKALKKAMHEVFSKNQELNAEIKKLNSDLQCIQAQSKKCEMPPAGWACSRGANHDGPCAASSSAVAHTDEILANYVDACKAAISLMDCLEIKTAKEYLELALKEGGVNHVR